MTSEPPTSPRIFVSHSSKDNEFGVPLVQSLRRKLEDENAVWYDSHGGLIGGDSWWETIKKELTDRPIFMVILSPQAMASKWVRDEISIAWMQKNALGGKHILPLLYQECEVPIDLKTVQMISFLSPESYENAFQKLLAALGQRTKAIAQQNKVFSSSPVFQKTKDQRKRILQVLYERRYDLPYLLDRVELADQIGKRWNEIQPDVTSLEEEKYVVTEPSEILSRTLHILRITPKGAKFFESDI